MKNYEKIYWKRSSVNFRMADFPLPYSYYPYDMIREVKKENTSVPKKEENSTELCKQWTDKDLSRWVVTPSAFNVHIRRGGLSFPVDSLYFADCRLKRMV